MSEYEPTEPVVEPMEEEPLRNEEEGALDAFVRYQRKAAEEGKLAFEALIPEGFRVHGREAKRAFKRSFKVLLTEIASRIEVPEGDEEAKPRRPKTTGKNKVKVEVS
jgi:hypothetical protein